MKEKLISIETSKIALDKNCWLESIIVCDGAVCLPSQSLFQRHLRENYGIQINIVKLKDSFMFFCFRESTSFTSSQKGFSKYEEALEVALQEGLEFIKIN